MNQPVFIPKAFISCSLRAEDRPFVNYVVRILKSFNIQPFGTVGRFVAAPVNPVALMREKIAQADFIVICATPRYEQTDLKYGTRLKGLSEMVHVEAGMAYASGKPVVVFVQKGTDPGSFISNITQYITLSGTPEDLAQKNLIRSLLQNAAKMAVRQKLKRGAKVAGGMAAGGLAVYGFVKLMEELGKARK